MTSPQLWRVCLKTDDPGWFDTDLNTEFAIASEKIGVSEADHLAMLHDAVDASFAPATVKATLTSELTEYA